MLNTIIHWVSRGIEGLLKPWQIKRVADAEAAVAVIRKRGSMEAAKLERSAEGHLDDQGAASRKNIEDITAQAFSSFEQKDKAGEIDKDWMGNFLDKARFVSDEEVQRVWVQVLVGEANRPGTYSKRTVNRLADMDRVDADLFTKLCRFGWDVGSFTPLIFDVRSGIYTDNGITFGILAHLESAGLIRFDHLADFLRQKLPKKFAFSYYNKSLYLEMPSDEGNELIIGEVLLTRAGEELAPIFASTPVDGFFEYVRERWKEHIPTTTTDSR